MSVIMTCSEGANELLYNPINLCKIYYSDTMCGRKENAALYP